MDVLVKSVVLFGLIFSLCACASNDLRWTEEVKLSDGKVVQIQRRVELTDSGFPFQQRGFNKYFEICYPPLNMHWKSKAPYQPDILDIVGGRAYMHVPISACISCMLFDYPKDDALYFAWEGGSWKRIRREEFPAAAEWNLFLSFKAAPGHEQDDAHGLVTLADKERPSSLRIEQQRYGWKRVNEQWPGIGQCEACSKVKVTTDMTPEIFVNDGAPVCSQ